MKHGFNTAATVLAAALAAIASATGRRNGARIAVQNHRDGQH
jgi:hypothetical protein